jgi:hypothetical protein
MRRKITTRRLGDVREDRTDWSRVDAQSEEELAEAIRADPDDEELEPGWVERATVLRPARAKEEVTTWEAAAIAAAVIKAAVFFRRV